MSEGLTVTSTRRARFWAYAPLILWVLVILVLGSSTGSMAQTSRFIRPLIEFFFPGAAPDTFLLIHAAIRKTAHFVEYFILAVLALRAFRDQAAGKHRHRYIASLLVVLIVAAVDEAQQSFVPGRTGSPWDIALDVAGGVTALALAFLIGLKRSITPSSEDQN